MEKSELRRLFDWGVCNHCMMVSEGWDPLTSSSSACPSCGFAGLGADWPPPSPRLLLRHAFRRQPEEQEEFSLQAFMVAEALDMILAWIIRRAIQYRFSEDPDRMGPLQDFRGFGLSTDQTLDLLKEVGGVRLYEIAEVLDEPDFPPRWSDLRDRHDRFAGSDGPQDAFAFDGLSDEDLAEVSRMAVKVFAHVNNAVW